VLGANHPKKAKFSIVVATTTSAAIGLVFTAVALAARKQMPRLFTGDDAVVKETAKLGYLLAATIFLNSIQPVLSGILNLGFDFTFLPPRNDETLTCSVYLLQVWRSVRGGSRWSHSSTSAATTSLVCRLELFSASS
jgi:hypothetical protein